MAKSYFKQNYCHACHTSFAVFLPLPTCCVSSLLTPLDSFFLEPGPAATMVGNIVMGTRIGGASGREIADIEEDSDMAKKVNHL